MIVEDSWQLTCRRVTASSDSVRCSQPLGKTCCEMLEEVLAESTRLGEHLRSEEALVLPTRSTAGPVSRAAASSPGFSAVTNLINREENSGQ